MTVFAENHSMYPRVGESDHYLRLRRAYHRFDHGEISESELKNIEDNYVEEVINEQAERGLDIVTDGMIRWYDHISHLADDIAGLEVAGLVRKFDTNYLVREARVTDHIEWRDPLVTGEFEFAQKVSDRPVKAILTGPLTMARHSIIEDSPYSDERTLTEDYASVLKEEVRALTESGMEEFQLEEPSVLQSPGDWEWLQPLVDDILEAADGANTRLATYFGDAEPLYDDLQDSAADVLTFDFTYSDTLLDAIETRGSDKSIGFGLLNGRNTKLAGVDETVDRLRPVIDSLDVDDHYVTFSCSLDYLPRDRAQQKLERLSDITEALRSKEGAVQA
jgi:5-methyltetrahydropteroyltriglutamate--homocysteine methyltransferase